MKKICWEELFHILHGRDVILTMMNGKDEQRELVQGGAEPLVGPLMQFHGNPIRPRTTRCTSGGSRARATARRASSSSTATCRRSGSLGRPFPDPKLRKDDDGVWEFTESDWDELKHVVTGHGPMTQERLELRKAARAGRRSGCAARPRRSGVTVYEVFRQERKGQPSPGAGAIAAPDASFAEAYARGAVRPARRVGCACCPARVGAADRGVRRRAQRNYHRVDGYPKEKLKEARERAGTAAPADR